MAGPIELPPTVIYGSSDSSETYAYDSSWDASFQSVPPYVRQILEIPLIASATTLNGEAVWDAVADGDSVTALNEVCKGISNQTYDIVKRQLAMHCYGAFSLGNAGLYSLAADQNATLKDYYGQFLTSGVDWTAAWGTHGVDFVGTPLMPVAAIGYWLFGGGIDRYVHIGSLDLQVVSTDFTPITDILNDASKGAGIYQLQASPFSYNTFSRAPLDLPAAGMIGRISGSLTGTLTITADGQYSFSGSFTLNPDRYDADLSNRSWAQEALTTFLRQLGDTFGHADYTINFLDAQKVEFTGSR